MTIRQIIAKELKIKDYANIMKMFNHAEGYSASPGSRYILNSGKTPLFFLGGSFEKGQGNIEIIDSENSSLEEAKIIVKRTLRLEDID